EETPAIEVDAEGAAIVRGEVAVREVNRALELELTTEEGVSTIAGLCMTLAGGIPHRGARLAAEGGVVLVVLDATTRGVRRVKVIPPPKPEKTERDETTEDDG
ncbi:MAG TPA: transporter associated domain-containing protein, partial [Polyangia bacterium]